MRAVPLRTDPDVPKGMLYFVNPGAVWRDEALVWADDEGPFFLCHPDDVNDVCEALS